MTTIASYQSPWFHHGRLRSWTVGLSVSRSVKQAGRPDRVKRQSAPSRVELSWDRLSQGKVHPRFAQSALKVLYRSRRQQREQKADDAEDDADVDANVNERNDHEVVEEEEEDVNRRKKSM
ncbi:unnamed protein product [Protopolystoma xenopodis]|uniref:Uncharacterized protein n=1 Tax=Protopolystoma xenopodis TaxID=117903 RepID=A0A448WQY5_9PLAT|nr:unnamed protein product [Protopolystoma xenopodis]